MASVTLRGHIVPKPFPERAGQQTQVAAQELVLTKGEVWRALGSDGWQAVRCLEGILWLTQTGDGKDYILRAGDAFLVTGPGKVVVEAIAAARVQVERLPPISRG